MRCINKSNALFESASKILPLGVTSNFRYWGPQKTLYLDRGKGAHVWDVDGNRYIDYRLGFGPAILGHSDDRVNEAVAEAICQGQTFALNTALEVQVAQKLTQLCPSLEMVRFANSGTEATMHAVRLARAYTRREKIIMFEGQYHGLHDYVMFTSAIGGDWSSSRYSPVAIPISSGIPEAVRNMVVMLPYNDLEELEAEIDQSWHDIAAVLVEPILGNAGGILPEPGWLELIRRLCDEYDIVMIMDEVKTGFRIARGGAQEYFGVTADLVTYAKALGNGYPVAAFGGKRDIMEQIGRGVSHGGTYAGNRVGMAAANAVLDIITQTDALATVAQRGRELMAMLHEVLSRAGAPCVVAGHPSMFSLWFAEKAPKEYRDWLHVDTALYHKIATGLIERGVMPDPDQVEPWFICAALSEQDIANTAAALEDTLREVLHRNGVAARHFVMA